LIAQTPASSLAAHYLLGTKWGLPARLGLRDLPFKLWWVSSQLVFFVAVPAWVTKSRLGIAPLDLGFRLKDALRHRKLYGAIAVVAINLTAVASYVPSFAHYYPMYQGAAASWVNLLAWEALYVLQFVAIEYFFRGFMLRGCERALGATAVFVMMIPYFLIHAGKPWPELLASVGAGFILGFLALTTRSLWGGLALHAMVGVGMDVFALLQTGRLPGRWGPFSW
jgi:hypothetical protein